MADSITAVIAAKADLFMWFSLERNPLRIVSSAFDFLILLLSVPDMLML
jgi:hypothetical protein